MRVNVLKRLATISKMEDEYSRDSEYSCEIKFPTIGSGMEFKGRLAIYDINDKFINELCLGVYSSGSTCYQKALSPVYEKRYDEQTREETLKGFDKDRKELKNVAEQINKIYEEAGKKAEAVLKKAGYSLKKGK